MESSFVEIEDLKIHYLEKNKKATATIFFIHGNSGSSRMWQRQLNSELLQQYRLVAIDLPGHGKSSASNNPERDYSPIGTAKILSQVVNELAANSPFILVGFSYGTNVMAEMLPYDISPSGIVMIGSCVLGENYGMEKIFIQHNSPSIFFYNETDQKTVSLFLHGQMKLAEDTDVQNSIEDYLNVSPEFKAALFKTAAEGKISDEINALQNLNVPVCLIFGEEDKMININYLDDLPFTVWQNMIYKVADTGHWVNADNPEAVNQLIFGYATERFILNHALLHSS
jgi:pimeloyl-ACP methyl ester carboxylesterase